MKQIRDNMRFAMSKASRFLDTSFKVTQLEQREKIFEQEVDEIILAEENEVRDEELYDSVKPNKKLEDEDFDQMNDNSDENEAHSEADVNATSKSKKRKTRK